MTAVLIAAVLLFSACGCSGGGAKGETPIMSVGGKDVYSKELNYWIKYAIEEMKSSLGTDTIQYDAEISSGKTYSEYILESAADTVKMYKIIDLKSGELGIGLTEEDETEIQDIRKSYIESYFTDEAGYQEALAEMGIDDELFTYMYCYIPQMYEKLYESIYGEGGTSPVTDEEALEYAASSGYMRAKHILLKTIDDNENVLPDDEKQIRYARMEDILA